MPQQNEEDISTLSLEEVRLLRDDHGKGIDICFQSNGRLVELNNPFATYSVGDMQYVVVGGEYPPWVTELIAGRRNISGKHFRIKLSSANVNACEIEIIEECLNILMSCDIFRDGGSYEAIWLTNYGKKWELFLEASREGVHAKDYTQKHTYLYRCAADTGGSRQPVLKKTKEDTVVSKMLDDWMNKLFNERQTNKAVMELFSTFKGMYYSIPWRTY
jgi:hypothetical protein